MLWRIIGGVMVLVYFILMYDWYIWFLLVIVVNFFRNLCLFCGVGMFKVWFKWILEGIVVLFKVFSELSLRVSSIVFWFCWFGLMWCVVKVLVKLRVVDWLGGCFVLVGLVSLWFMFLWFMFLWFIGCFLCWIWNGVILCC